MYTGKLVFSQVMDFVPVRTFRQCVARYHGNFKVKSFSCLDPYLCMAFAQLTYRESLRDIETCLRSQQQKLYHMGIRGKVSRSTITDANEQRDWRIYADLAHALIPIARRLYSSEQFTVELEQTAYALDATTIDLCLSVFPWAHFRKTKSAIKLHTLLDLRGSIPTFIHISDGKFHEVNSLDMIPRGTRRFLRDGSGISGFRQTLRPVRDGCLLPDPRQIKHEVPQGVFPSGRLLHWMDLRSVGDAHRGLSSQGLSQQNPPCKVLRHRNRQNLRVPDQQLLAAATDYRATVSLPLAGGTVFQVDQAGPPHQELLWHLGECREDADLDCHLPCTCSLPS